MNWGWKLTIVYVAFAAGILTMVFKAKGQKVDLVSKDYYKQELEYGHRMEAMRNAQTLSGDIAVKSEIDLLEINYPQDVWSGVNQGKVNLYCPSDSESDKTFDLVPDATGKQIFATNGFKKGLYLVKFSWTKDDKEYYIEKSVDLR